MKLLNILVLTFLFLGCSDSLDNSTQWHPTQTEKNLKLRGIETAAITPEDDILDITFSSDNTKIYAAGHSLGIHIIDKASLNIISSIDTNGLAHDIKPMQAVGYFAVANQQGGLLILEESSDTLAIVAQDNTLSATNIAILADGTIAVASGEKGLSLLTFNSATNTLLKLSSYVGGGYAQGLYFNSLDGFLYLASTHRGVDKIDISDTTNPTSVHTFSQASNAHDTLVDGNFLYVANRDKGVYIFDITAPTQKAVIVETQSEALGLDIYTDTNKSKKYLVVADGEGGISLINIDDPTQAQYAIFAETPGWAHQVQVVQADKVAYVSDSNYGLRQMDLSKLNISYFANHILNNRTYYVVADAIAEVWINSYDNDGISYYDKVGSIRHDALYEVNSTNTILFSDYNITLTYVSETDDYIVVDRNDLGIQRWYNDENKAIEYKNSISKSATVSNGVQKTYYPTGELEFETTYVNGLREGKAFQYYKSGAKKAEGLFANDLLNGQATSYYESGALEEIGEYINGLVEGTYTSYYESGAVKATEENINGLGVCRIPTPNIMPNFQGS